MKIIQWFTKNLEKIIYNNNFFFRLYSIPYKKVVKKEIQLGKITKEDTILNVGCGAIPYTAIYIAEITGAKVFAMDKDKKAVVAANKLIDRLNLSNNIEFLTGDAAKDVPKKIDKAIVALQVEPKEDVLYRLLDTKASAVIMRAPRKELKNLYGTLPSSIKPISGVKHKMLTFDRSVLYKKDSSVMATYQK